MYIPHNEPKILLVGTGLIKVDLLIDAFNKVGAELLFAEDAIQAMKMLCFESPQLVIFDSELPADESSMLCRTIRANPQFSSLPVVFAGSSSKGYDAVFNALSAGADDYVTDFSNTDGFLARMMWMMEQRNDALARRREYESVRMRHLQTLAIVKETSTFLAELSTDITEATQSRGEAFDQRMAMGLEMVSGLAKILEEQIETADRLLGPRVKSIADVDLGAEFDPLELDGHCDLSLRA